MIRQLRYRCRGYLLNNVQKSLLSFLMLLLFASLSPIAMTAEEPVSGRTPPSDYGIGPEDLLEISVWREEDLQRQVLVRPDGKISFPLAGDIQAAGRTTEQVQQDIKQKLQRYIPDPVVTVTVVTVGGNKIYVIGQVNNPGAYVIGRYVDVLQALTVAGGLTPFASENKIKVLRREGDQEIVFPFEYADVKKGKNLEQNVILKGGDTVVVP
ncbi:MAG: polysaccharide biosynthesis/export family protein [Gammaproteobacteria bacterium]